MLLPSLLAAPIGCTALIVGAAAASDPRLRSRSSSPLLSPALIAAGAALALGPAVDSWFPSVATAWLVLQVVAAVALVVVVLLQDGRRAGYGAPDPSSPPFPPPDRRR